MKMCSVRVVVVACAGAATVSSVAYGETAVELFKMVNFRLDGSSDFDFDGIQARPLALGVEAGISFGF